MTINGFTYLDEPVEGRNGAKSLYPRLFPMRNTIYFVIENESKTEDGSEPKKKSTLILNEETKIATAKDNLGDGDTKVRIIAVGPECKELECGDVIMPIPELFQGARCLEMYDGAEFYKYKEIWADGIFAPDE